MRRLYLAGAWYAAALPNGHYGALYAGEHVETSQGNYPVPPGDQPLFLDAGYIDERVCVAGQSHAGRGLLLHDGQQWRTPDIAAFGESPVCFGLGDTVLSVQPGDTYVTYHVRNGVREAPVSAPLGADGLHGVTFDGHVLRGNNTRADTARILGEFTEIGDVTIGQSGYSCVALYGGKRYVLITGAKPGGCRFIRFKREGDLLAIAVHLPSEGGTVLLWMTVAELTKFPEQVLGAPTPQPKPEPTPVSIPNHQDVVARERAKYPAKIGDAESFAITNAVAADPAVAADGWGLIKAPAGGHGYVMYGQNYRVDKLCRKDGYVLDLLGASGTGASTPQWGVNVDPNGNANNWAPPIRTMPAPPETPAQPPVDNGADLAALRNEVAALSVKLALLEARVSSHEDNSKENDTDMLKVRVAALEQRKWKATGSTSRDFAHSHRINVTLEPAQ